MNNEYNMNEYKMNNEYKKVPHEGDNNFMFLVGLTVGFFSGGLVALFVLWISS